MNTDNKNSSVRCVRAPRDSQHPYFMTARAVAQDTDLSLDERGLLWYILSLPDDWVAHPLQLGKANGVKSKEKIYKLFKSLMKAGYCERKNIRKEGRHDATVYMFYEDKQQRLIDLYKDTPKSDPSFLKNRNQKIQVPEKQDPVKQDITDNTLPTEKKKKKSAALPIIEFNYETLQFENIQESDILSWLDLYPGVDVKRELGLMRQWLMAPENPERQGGRSFISNWLSKAFKEVKRVPKKPKVEQPPANPSGNDIPYNSSIAYSILRRDGIESYVDYLKAVNEKKYYNNYLKGQYEQNYIDYVTEKGIE